MTDKIIWFEKNLNNSHTHGNNVLAKLKQLKSLKPSQKKQIEKVVVYYKLWNKNNEGLRGYSESDIKKSVKWLNDYKDKIESVDFSAQSKFHSTVLEEFLYYLFRNLVEELNMACRESEEGKRILLGGIRAYSNLYFAPENLADFIKRPNMRINEKNQDFAIYREILIKADGEEKEVNVPVISAECKTYIDKTMLEGSIATAEKIKHGNPYCRFLVVTEWYDVSFDVDPAYSRIDQIFVLRKQKRRSDRNNPINFDVVKDLFGFVKDHLERDWSSIEKKLSGEGKIL